MMFINLRDSEKESSCYADYLNCMKKNSNGRYEVELLFKENHPVIHDHSTLCKRRFCNTVTRLKRNPELSKQYDNIFKQHTFENECKFNVLKRELNIVIKNIILKCEGRLKMHL